MSIICQLYLSFQEIFAKFVNSRCFWYNRLFPFPDVQSAALPWLVSSKLVCRDQLLVIYVKPYKSYLKVMVCGM